MRRRLAWLTALLLGVSCAATGIGPPGTAVNDTQRTHEREVDRSEFRFRWPFTTGTGTLSCDAGAIVIRTAGVTYGLNEEAAKRGFPSAIPILLQQRVPPTNPLGRVPQGDRERIFVSAAQCDRAGDAASCRSRLADQHRLTAEELEQILVEGRERRWPPLEPKRMSVDAIVEAGRALCAH
jgi:hypothetical protein